MNEKLRKARRDRRWTIEEAAERIGVSRTTYIRWEQGTQKPQSLPLNYVCKAFSMTPEQLGFVEWTEPSTQPSALPEPQVIIRTDRQFQSKIENTLNELLPESGSDVVNRRDFFQRAGQAAITSATLFVAHEAVNAELLDRFNRALKRPATFDNRLLDYLQSHMEGYWKDHYHAALASYDLLGFVQEHFQKIVKLLENPLLPTARAHLCITASGTALLIGTLFFDMADYKQAMKYFKAAIQAATEANEPTLQAVGWGWMSLTWTYGAENLQKALAGIQTARSLAEFSPSITVRAWLAAIEAELHAKMHSSQGCLRALDEAAQVEVSEPSEIIHYWTSYDRVQFEGYKGTCYQLLYKQEDKHTHAYLSEAQRTLQEALSETDPVIRRLQSVFLCDLASTYIQQREIEQACHLAQKALMVNTLQSQMIVQRITALRRDLEPWKNVQEVRELGSILSCV